MFDSRPPRPGLFYTNSLFRLKQVSNISVTHLALNNDASATSMLTMSHMSPYSFAYHRKGLPYEPTSIQGSLVQLFYWKILFKANVTNIYLLCVLGMWSSLNCSGSAGNHENVQTLFDYLRMFALCAHVYVER